MVVGVTGATGGLGGRVARHLAERGVPLRLVVRDPARAPELPGAAVAVAAYGDGEALRRAFDGVGTLFLVSAAEDADRMRLHRSAVDAAAAAGVERIVYTSFVNAAPDATFTFARDHFHTEEHIRAAGIPATILRNSLYLDFMPYMTGKDGVIRGPAGDGRFGGVARDDIGEVAATVLLDGGHEGRTYTLTGPEALSFHDVVALLTELSGRTVTYQDETLEEAYASRAHYGVPAFEVEGWVTNYTAIAAGELAEVTDTVDKLTGHPPTSLRDWLLANPASWAHLRPQPPGA